MTHAILTPKAKADLKEIALYIARRNPERATTITNEIIEHCCRIGIRPRIGRARPDIGPNIRSVPHGRYMIFYRITDTCMEIVHVLHGARDIKN